jgi:hypothetical protein
MTITNQWTDIQELLSKSRQLLIKKLSRNDCSWADDSKNGHQNGVYIPREIRESGFFPPLKNTNLLKPHIFEAQFNSFWPISGEIKPSNLKHYSNKGTEMHFTGVPKSEFAGLTPASLLVGGILISPIQDCHHWFMVIDSSSEEVELVESMFNLAAEFHFGLFDPAEALQVQQDETEQLIDELSHAIRSGSLATFISSVSKMPKPETLALEAQKLFLREHGLNDLNPYGIPNPGDAIMKISRDIEYSLYKKAERRYRAAEVIRIINNHTDIVTAVVRGFPDLDATFLSASQHRKSRAGRSFENHISRSLRDASIAFEEQIITGSRRPDFVLPSLLLLKSENRNQEDALILSAKTTLRERWKQVALEKFHCELFLATVDDRVSDDAIDDMHQQGIKLIVPESLKDSKETCYVGKTNVITFREFFDEEIAKKRPHIRYS